MIGEDVNPYLTCPKIYPEDNGEKVGNAENEPRDIPQNQGRPDFRENTDINSQATPQVESDQETNRIRPESNSDRSGANDSKFGQFRDNQKRSMDEENTASGDNSMIVFWIVISAAALALGLIIVKLFRR